jgi:anthranilate synthase component 2
MKTVIIDNYDSFTYNLVHLVNEIIQEEVVVMRNDKIDNLILEKAESIILSPGPGIPDEAGDLKKVVNTYSHSKKILGVCLGHQAIGECFGATLYNLKKVYHGQKMKMIRTEVSTPLFQNVPKEFYAGRYHSWAIDRLSNTSAFYITVIDEENEIMAIQHKSLNVFGVQFHPESIMTEYGKTMLDNFLNKTK